MKFAILSIPHTGTHFVTKLLTGETEVNMGTSETLYTSHVYKLSAFEKAQQEGYVIVCPMRHPVTTMHSWAKWAAKLPENYSGDIVSPKNVPTLYRNLIWADELFDVNFIPIDSPHRDEYLDRFNKKYSLSLSTVWKPENSIGESRVQAAEYLIEKVARLMKDNREFFENFYND
jgi:hypothetical protein